MFFLIASFSRIAYRFIKVILFLINACFTTTKVAEVALRLISFPNFGTIRVPCKL